MKIFGLARRAYVCGFSYPAAGCNSELRKSETSVTVASEKYRRTGPMGRHRYDEPKSFAADADDFGDESPSLKRPRTAPIKPMHKATD